MFQKLETDSYCVGRRHGSATTKFVGEKTCTCNKVLIGHCSIWKRKKSMTVSDITLAVECLGDFFKNLRKKGSKQEKIWQENVLRNPGRAFEIGENVGTAFSSWHPTYRSFIIFTRSGRFVSHWKKIKPCESCSIFLPLKYSKKHQDYTHLHH